MINILSFVKSIFSTKKSLSNFVLYKIIDCKNERKFILQCLNSKSIFEADITEIVSDPIFLKGLHPLQACFVGIEYAKHLKENRTIKDIEPIQNSNLDYGEYLLTQNDRNGLLYFKDLESQEEFIMQAVELIFNNLVLSKFHATQAFHIGIYAGLRIHKNLEKLYPLSKTINLI